MARSSAEDLSKTGQAAELRDAVRGLLVAHHAFDEVKRPCGTPLAAPHAWALLELRGGPLRVTALAARLRIDRSNVSRLCTHMERTGEVERVVDPDDRRARRIALTPMGEARAAAVDGASRTHFAALLAALETAPEGAIATLHALTRAMRTVGAPHTEEI